MNATNISTRIDNNQTFKSHLLNCGFEMVTNETYKKGNWFVYVNFHPLPHGVVATNSVTGEKETLGMQANIEDFRCLVGLLHTPNLKKA